MEAILFITVILSSFAHTKQELVPNSTEYVKDYCDIVCNGEKHTMCRFKGRSPTCHKYEVPYDTATAEMMLETHNDLRNQFASGGMMLQMLPNAANMRLMRWDQELATIAHRWLSQCIIGHDTCRDLKHHKVGQNFAFITSSEVEEEQFSKGESFLAAFSMWTREMVLVTEKDVKSFNIQKMGLISNFSQMMWHNTYRVGCSYVIYAVHNEKIKAYACNYMPKGNVQGQPMFEAGTAGSNCPQGTKLDGKFHYLCRGEPDNEKDDFELIVAESGAPKSGPLQRIAYLILCFF